MGGGAVYSNLNFAYQVGNEKGAAPESDEFKQYMRKLKEFITAFDFVRMRPDSRVIAGGAPEGSISRAISEPGKQYGIYVHHSTAARGLNRYEVNEQPKTLSLALELPAGSYRAEWVQPGNLTILKTQDISKHAGGKLTLAASPEHTVDIAMRIVKH